MASALDQMIQMRAQMLGLQPLTAPAAPPTPSMGPVIGGAFAKAGQGLAEAGHEGHNHGPGEHGMTPGQVLRTRADLTRKYGDPNSAGYASNLTTVNVGGQKWQVHKAAAPSIQGFLNELAGTGYKLSSSGGYNNRDVRGRPGTKSIHSWGLAFDVNAGSNPLGSRRTDLPAGISQMAKKYGLHWGGDWKGRPDPMHFSWGYNG